MTDIVERLRTENTFDHTATDKLLDEAADEIERLRRACDGYLGELAAMRENKDTEIERLTAETSHWMDEAARLQNMKANLHSHIKRLEDENSGLRKKNAIHASNTLAAIDDYNDALAENARLKAGTTEPTNKRDRYYQRKSHRDQHEGIEALKAEAAKLREALEKIARMKTMPDHVINTCTLATAHAIARAALSAEKSNG